MWPVPTGRRCFFKHTEKEKRFFARHRELAEEHVAAEIKHGDLGKILSVKFVKEQTKETPVDIAEAKPVEKSEKTKNNDTSKETVIDLD